MPSAEILESPVKTYTCQKEQPGNIQGQINKIRNSVEDKQSQLAWLWVYEVSGRKSTLRTKLKVASQGEGLQNWKEYSMNLLCEPPEVTDEPHKNY